MFHGCALRPVLCGLLPKFECFFHISLKHVVTHPSAQMAMSSAHRSGCGAGAAVVLFKRRSNAALPSPFVRRSCPLPAGGLLLAAYSRPPTAGRLRLAACCWPQLLAANSCPPATRRRLLQPPTDGRLRLAACYWPPTTRTLLLADYYWSPPSTGRLRRLAAYSWPPRDLGATTLSGRTGPHRTHGTRHTRPCKSGQQHAGATRAHDAPQVLPPVRKGHCARGREDTRAQRSRGGHLPSATRERRPSLPRMPAHSATHLLCLG